MLYGKKKNSDDYAFRFEGEEEIAKSKLFELIHYLNSTDWYVIRFAEEGIPIPTEVKEKRHQSRCEISKLREIVKE